MNTPHHEIDKLLQDIDIEEQQNNEEILKLATRNIEIAEQRKALQEQKKLPVFDTNKRTVQWQGGSLKLSPQRFQILYTLYFAENRQATITDLETAIWEKDVPHSTIKTAVSRLGTILTDAVFPFYIDSVFSDGGIYEVSDRRGVRKAKIRLSLAGYKLVSRVTENGNSSQNSIR